MIEIERNSPPEETKLATDGPHATNALVESWRQNSSAFTPEIDQKIYASVKSNLSAMQYGKCCYCEANLSATSYGDVEHFRPKKSVDEDANHPGYWWLAYSWDNLLFSCARCNRGHKRTHFPLEDSSTRASTPDDDLELEVPTLVHSCEEDPTEHIGFRREVAYGKTSRGEFTIKLLGLNRRELCAHPDTGEMVTDGLLERRAEQYRSLKALYEPLQTLLEYSEEELAPLKDNGKGLRETAEDMWQNFVENILEDPKAEFVGMIRDALEVEFTLKIEL